MKKYIGIDVGGTKIEGVLVNENLKVIKHAKTPTETTKSRTALIEKIIKVVNELKTSNVYGLGIGVPGFANQEGKIKLTPNITQFENFNLKKALEKKLKHKILIGNDANLFTLAEQRAGAARGMKNVLGLTLGTGVGGGAIIDGKLYRGKSGGAAHFGQIIIDKSGMKCWCGLKGDLESWCGGRYMEKNYKALTEKNKTAREIFESNEKIAKKIVENFYEKLSIGIANLIYTFNPECIVLGGSISNRVNIISLKKAIGKYTHKTLVKDVKILKNKLGNSAGMYGAAFLAMNH
ncbi:hypothetical protein CMO88_05045 [Candidatus Woesearchaeota archaeon]|nr:hypothetical protein [Candidatus Woesearchaeota archaeon]|tara:strand:+ start:8251 stop:9126 length:876 start_codon:yes stop_codon:yes gene_type:complete